MSHKTHIVNLTRSKSISYNLDTGIRIFEDQTLDLEAIAILKSYIDICDKWFSTYSENDPFNTFETKISNKISLFLNFAYDEKCFQLSELNSAGAFQTGKNLTLQESGYEKFKAIIEKFE